MNESYYKTLVVSITETAESFTFNDDMTPSESKLQACCYQKVSYRKQIARQHSPSTV